MGNGGRKNKALYYYELSLRENPEYDPVLKRMGLLLADSVESIATAIFYLEKYHRQKKTTRKYKENSSASILPQGMKKKHWKF